MTDRKRAARRRTDLRSAARLLCVIAGTALSHHGAAAAEPSGTAARPGPIVGDGDKSRWRAEAAVVLEHLYTVYQAIHSCTEISAQQNDRSFLPLVSIDEARQSLRRIDAAIAEVGIDSTAIWNRAMPRAVVTAEALKTDPASHLEHCQSTARLFRVDAATLQNILSTLGAEKAIIAKDY